MQQQAQTMPATTASEKLSLPSALYAPPRKKRHL